ncbi:uncharacterized protein V6R79_017547 [Siganus canaliculatus]
MGELGRIKFSLFVMMLLLQFAEPTQLLLDLTVRDGDEATLSCESVTKDQSNCDGTTWSFESLRREEVALVERGQKVGDRLSLTENCSLVIKEVRAEDAGRYFCKQNKSGTEQKTPGEVSLSVVSMTEQRINDQVTLYCTLTTPGRCTRLVRWSIKGRTVVISNEDIKLTESSCFTSVTFLTSFFSDSSWPSFFGCEVTDGVSSKLFSLRRPPSGDEPADEASSEPGPSALDYVMLLMRVAELVFITVITALLFRTQRNVAPAENKTLRRGAEVNYINVGETSASAHKHRRTNPH